MKKVHSFLLVILVFISGCSVKNDDSTLTKGVKHTLNAPLYVIVGVGAVGHMAGGALGYGVSKTIDTIGGAEVYLGETYLGKNTEQALDNNTSLAKFYTDFNYAFYKDKDNTNYMLNKANGDFIKNVKFLHKRWSVARLEKRPTIPLRKVILKKGTTKDDIRWEKIGKDKFGNPIFFGDNILVKVSKQSTGFLSFVPVLYLIPGGARTVSKTDSNAPDSFKEQIDYYVHKKDE